MQSTLRPLHWLLHIDRERLDNPKFLSEQSQVPQHRWASAMFVRVTVRRGNLCLRSVPSIYAPQFEYLRIQRPCLDYNLSCVNISMDQSCDICYLYSI